MARVVGIDEVTAADDRLRLTTATATAGGASTADGLTSSSLPSALPTQGCNENDELDELDDDATGNGKRHTALGEYINNGEIGSKSQVSNATHRLIELDELDELEEEEEELDELEDS